MRLLILLPLLAAIAAANTIPEDIGSKELHILHLLYKVTEPIRHRFTFLKKQAETYKPLDHLNNFKDSGEAVKTLSQDLEDGLVLQQKHWFSLFNEQHKAEAILLFEVLIYSKDYYTFISNAAYFREKLNEGVFVYALYAAVTHSEHTIQLVLPPLYEITPNIFANSEVMDLAYTHKMQQKPGRFLLKFTGTKNNPEQRVAYFGEDIGMNVHHVSWHLRYPFWWKDIYGKKLDRKGELFFWAHHQLNARYDSERLSNNLDHITELSWEKPLENGFAPHVAYKYGGEFPYRADNVKIEDVEGVAKIRHLKLWEGRILDAVHQGHVKALNKTIIDIQNEKGIGILGDLLESSEHTVNKQFYGYLHNLGHIVIGKQVDPKGKYDFPPSVLEHFETSTRDPAFFQLHKYLNQLFKEHKDQLNPYTKEDLEFTGISVESVGFSQKLVTFFEDFEFDLTFGVDDTEAIEDVSLIAVTKRIQHEPFSFIFEVNNNNEEQRLATFRVFLCPKYDNNKNTLNLEESRWNCVEMDKFWKILEPGANKFERKSINASTTTPDSKNFTALEDMAINHANEIPNIPKPCGFPNRFLLPKGKPEGLNFTLFVAVTEGQQDTVYENVNEVTLRSSHSHCGLIGGFYPDKRPLGFPLDRQIPDERVFDHLSNIHKTTVTITHHENHHP